MGTYEGEVNKQDIKIVNGRYINGCSDEKKHNNRLHSTHYHPIQASFDLRIFYLFLFTLKITFTFFY